MLTYTITVLDGGGFGEFGEVCVEPPSSALNTTLRAFAAERRRVQCAAAIDRHLLPTTANPPAAVVAADRWEKRYTNPAPHGKRAASVRARIMRMHIADIWLGLLLCTHMQFTYYVSK